jgi:hypothetical protein
LLYLQCLESVQLGGEGEDVSQQGLEVLDPLLL